MHKNSQTLELFKPVIGSWIAVFSLLIAIFWLEPGLAKTIDGLNLAGLQRVSIIVADFDPPTRQDQELIDRALARGAQAVVVVPRSETADPMALPVQLRLNLLSLQYSNQPQVLVPSNYISVGQIKSANPSVRIEVLNSDEPSDSIAELRRNFALYFAENLQDAQCPPVFVPAVCHEIFAKGYYVGRDRNNRINRHSPGVAALRRLIVVSTDMLGLKEVRSRLARKAKQQPMLEGQIELPGLEGRKVNILSRLGHGYFANAYLVEFQGRKLVLSQPHKGEQFQKVLASRIETALWVQEFSRIAIAPLVEYDREGRWALSEFIEGPSLREEMEKDMPTIQSLLRNPSMKELFKEFRRLQDEHGIFLDVTPANVILQNGTHAVLVDLGQMPQPRWPTLGKAMVNWYKEIYNSSSWSKRRNTSRDCEALLVNDI